MTVKKLLSLIIKVALVLLLSIIVGALAVLTIVPRAVHGETLTVLTGSMTPHIPAGSVVVVRPVDPGTLHVGDVITYQKTVGKAEYITHRITAIHTSTSPVTLTTKGDANRGPDAFPVPVTAVRGKVLFHVPYLGTFRSAVSGGALGLPLAILGLLGYAVTQLAGARRVRRAPAPESAQVPAASTAPARLDIQLVVATLRSATFDGLSAQRVAGLLHMDLVDETEEVFTLARTGTPDQVEALAEDLCRFHPVAVQRSDIVHVAAHGGSSVGSTRPADQAQRALA